MILCESYLLYGTQQFLFCITDYYFFRFFFLRARDTCSIHWLLSPMNPDLMNAATSFLFHSLNSFVQHVIVY